MLDALTGFAVVGLAIVVGYVIGRIDLLGEHARPVLARLTFFVLSPFLLFVVLSQADVAMLFSALLPVSAIAAAAVMVVQIVFMALWRRRLGETVIGALGAGLVNSNNIGIPLSLYLLGSAAYPAPIILLQLMVFTPIALGILDAVTSGSRSLWRVIRRTLTNPIVVGSVLGVLVALSGWEMPPIILEPAELIAGACVPVLLISYGMSLHGQRVLAPSDRRRDILLASALKLIAMPIVAWLLAEFAFALSPAEVLIVTTLAALPSAQNVFNTAQRYGIGDRIARDVVFVTTVGCVPVLAAIAVLLG